MIIRTVTDEDLPKLIWKGLEEWEETIYKEFAEREEKGTLWLVAEENGEPVGQILATVKGKFGKPYLSALRVRPDLRGKGIGTQLIQKAEEALKRQGASIITISVDVENRAIRLYERLGYVRVGEVRKEHWVRTYKGKQIEEDIVLYDLEKHIS